MRNPSSLFGRFPFYLALLIFSLAGIVSVTGKGTHGNRSTHLHDGITETYFWDFENRLTGLEKPGTGSYSYIYDHRTRRVVRDESGAGGDEAILSFSGGTSVQEWSNSLLVSEQIRGSDWGGGVGGVLYTIRNNQRSYNSYNSRGDVVSASDQTGTATWQASYEAFGTRTQEEGTNAERQRANTKDEDPTGLLNEGFRYRDLETGVFISRDPAGFVDGPNVYTYVRQNPWTKFDPLGLWETDSYWGDVGQVYVGMGRAIKGTVVGLGTMVAHPVQTAQGIGHAVANPVETGKAIIADYGQKLETNAGVGEIVGEVLIGVATGGATKAAAETATVSKIATKLQKLTGKLDEAAELGGVTVREVVEETAANSAGRANTLVHNGLEVRAVRDLSHIDNSTLGAMAEKGFAPRTINGDKIVLHHHQQNPAGFIVEMPAKNHNIWNTNQHPFGNAPGVGLSAEQRTAFDAWRVDY